MASITPFSFFLRVAKAATVLGFLTACSSSVTDERGASLLRNDFEQLDGWCPPSPSLTTEMAHSGQYAIKVAPGLDYSLTFVKPIGLLSPKRLHKVRLSAWINLPEKESDGANLALTLNDPAQNNQQVFGDGIALSDQVRSLRKWTKVSKEITLPSDTQFTYELRIYVWRAGATAAVYADDIRLEEIK